MTKGPGPPWINELAADIAVAEVCAVDIDIKLVVTQGCQPGRCQYSTCQHAPYPRCSLCALGEGYDNEAGHADWTHADMGICRVAGKTAECYCSGDLPGADVHRKIGPVS